MTEGKKETPGETVERLSALARIRIPDERKEALAAEFEHILSYIAQLDELTLPPRGAQAAPALHNIFRVDGDANETGEWTETIVKTFPSKSGTSLTVKKIISHD